MDKRMAVFVIYVCLANTVFAAGFNQPEITASTTYVSRYIWRGQDIFSNNDPAFHPSVDVLFEDFINETSLGLNIWAAIPFNGGHEDLEETDYTLYLEDTFLEEQLSVAAGYTYFDFPNTASSADVQEPWIEITLNKIPGLEIDISPSLFLGYDFAAESGGPDEGWYYSWGLNTEASLPALPIFQEGQVFSIGVINWGNDGVSDLEPDCLYATDISFATSYNVGKFSITPGLNYTINHNENINSGNEEIWGGFDISCIF